jgi:hypothetical protein
MKYLYFLFIGILLPSAFNAAHAQKILRASLSTSAKDAHNIHIGSYKVQQSIGHMGIIGSVRHGQYTVLREFLLPQHAASDPITPDLDIQVYPNPFVDHIDIAFDTPVSGDLVVMLHDMTGQLVASQIAPAKKRQRIALANLAQAHYILTVDVMGKQFSYNLLNKRTINKD